MLEHLRFVIQMTISFFNGNNMQKTTNRHFLICVFSAFILLFISTFSPAQNWQWAKQSKQKSFSGLPYATSLHTDAHGNAYLLGRFGGDYSGENYKIIFGADTLSTDSSSTSSYLVKYDPEGDVVWAKGTGQQSRINLYAFYSATDTSGNTYVLSSFDSTVTIGSHTVNGSGELLIIKYDSSGNVLWAKDYASPRRKLLKGINTTSIATDISSNIYVTGYFDTTCTVGSYTLVPKEAFGTEADVLNVFTAKFDLNGNLLWVRSSHGYGIASDITSDNSGSAIITGTFLESLVVFDTSTLTNTHLNSNPHHTDIFTVKYDANGNVLWAKSSDGGKFAAGSSGGGLGSRSITTDISGNVYITGDFADSTLIMGTDTLTNNAVVFSWGIFFTAKYDGNGNVLWARANGGNSDAFGSGITTDKQKNVYAVGSWNYQYNPSQTISFGSIVLSAPAVEYSYPIFIVKYDSSGSVLCAYTSPSGGLGFISGFNPIATGPSGSIYVAGTAFSFTVGDTLVFGPDTLFSNPDEGGDYVFIGRYDCCGIIKKEAASLCKGDSVMLTALGGATYLWNNGETANAIQVDPVTTTTYSVTTDKEVCSANKEIQITVNALPDITVCCSATILTGESVTLNISPLSSGNTYSWTPTDGLDCISCASPNASPSATTKYYISVTNSSGCETSDSIMVFVQISCHEFFIPDVFSPNGDGQNDEFYFYSTCVKELTLTLYNRWGEVVFETQDPAEGWDGTFNNKAMHAAVFFYSINTVFKDGTAGVKNGNLTLVR